LEVPCLVHGDSNFHNVIVGADSDLIDWDGPAVRYPLDHAAAHWLLHRRLGPVRCLWCPRAG